MLRMLSRPLVAGVERYLPGAFVFAVALTVIVAVLALVFGDLGDGRNVPVRLHRESMLADVFSKRRPLDAVLERLAAERRGVLVYLRDGTAGVPATSLAAQFSGEAHDSAQSRDQQWHEIGLGAQILKDLGVVSIRLLASRERHYVGLAGFGIEIAETVILEG